VISDKGEWEREDHKIYKTGNFKSIFQTLII
jgi:hypothetical protein